MGRLLLVALVGLLVWRFLRGRGGGEAIVVAWTDGSSLTVEAGAPEHDRLVAAARAVVGR
jgi:hypothetical protein